MDEYNTYTLSLAHIIWFKVNVKNCWLQALKHNHQIMIYQVPFLHAYVRILHYQIWRAEAGCMFARRCIHWSHCNELDEQNDEILMSKQGSQKQVGGVMLMQKTTSTVMDSSGALLLHLVSFANVSNFLYINKTLSVYFDKNIVHHFLKVYILLSVQQTLMITLEISMNCSETKRA